MLAQDFKPTHEKYIGSTLILRVRSTSIQGCPYILSTLYENGAPVDGNDTVHTNQVKYSYYGKAYFDYDKPKGNKTRHYLNEFTPIARGATL